MSFLLDMLASLAATVVRNLLEIPLIWLGDTVWWTATLGKHRPQWDLPHHRLGGTCVLLAEIRFWIGAITAVLIGLGVRALL